MYRISCKPGARLTQQERDTIEAELHSDDPSWCIHRAMVEREESEHCRLSAEDFVNHCRERAGDGLETFIEHLCCDPALAVTRDKKEQLSYRRIVEGAFEGGAFDLIAAGTFESASVPYFHDILGALFDYKECYERCARENYVETSIGKIVFEALDYALETGRSVLIEGNSGVGKTTALKAWCHMHPGRARYIPLKGVTYRTQLFRELALALGLARGGGLSSSKVQMRVEEFLKRTKIMLVFDEGQYLFPPGNRVYAPPELINWLMTACYNEGVPFAISATAEFRARRAVVEKNTTWQSEQLRRRLRRHFALPETPTKDDLQRVARKLLPDFDRAGIDYVVGYSMASKGFFQAITDAIEDARIIARRSGRDGIIFKDLKTAVQDWRSPSDAAMQRVFQDQPKKRRDRGAGAVAAPDQAPERAGNNGSLTDGFRPVNRADRQEISLVSS